LKYFLFYLEKTLGTDKKLLIKLETEVNNYKKDLDTLSDITEEQKLEVQLKYWVAGFFFLQKRDTYRFPPLSIFLRIPINKIIK